MSLQYLPRILFLAAVLPFSLMSVKAFGVHTSAAALLVVPALMFWMVLDLAIGVAIVCAAISLLITAATMTKHRVLCRFGQRQGR